MSILTSEENIKSESITKFARGRHAYSPEYKRELFFIWYKAGKPGGHKLHQLIDVDPDIGTKPTAIVLNGWIRKDFQPEADVLDGEVIRKMEENVVKEKVEMLKRHSELGVKLQTTALEYLDEHKDEIKVPMAVKMLIEGVRIERESKGIPQMLNKMLDMDEEKLLKETQELLLKSPVEFEEIEEITDDIEEEELSEEG